MSRPDLTLARELEAALAWWQMAGVDCDFADDATTWLAAPPQPETPAKGAGALPGRNPAPGQAIAKPQAGQQAPSPFQAAAAHAAPSRRAFLGESPPSDIATFRQWWMESANLSPSHGFPRVPPRGEAGAALMVLVSQPEEPDGERLLSGPQGRLLANILAAMRLDESAVYIAATLPSHTPMADMPMLAASGMDAVTLHHIGLVAPARLIAFGTGLAPMLGELSDHPLREINYAGGKVPVLSSEALDALMDMPRLKARFWRRWMEWSATN